MESNREAIPFSRVVVVYSVWWLVWMIEQVYLFRSWGWPWMISLTDALVMQMMLGIGGYVMNTSLRYYRPGQKSFLYMMIWSFVMAGIISAMQIGALTKIFADEGSYLAFLDQSVLIRYLFNWLMIAFIALISWIWFFIREQQENEKRKQVAENLARDAELTNLRQQLQPHFLFNSLNSISALVGTQPEQARQMVQQLSDFLRGTLKKDEKQMAPLEDELKHLRLYLEIEKVRFGHRLQTTISNSDEALHMVLPALLLQPVVENAIKFGLYDTTGETRISIDARAENDMLVVEVNNPFDPVTSVSRQGTGFGLNSVQRRLYLLFSRNDLLSTSQHENIFTTRIRIPQNA